jgi:heme exporter protein D
MMDPVNHIGFIVAAYAAAVVVVAGLIGWVAFDYRAQRRALAELERRGIARRSASARAARTSEPAKEQV